LKGLITSSVPTPSKNFLKHRLLFVSFP